MAGRGSAPKQNRARSNAPARGEWARLEPLAAAILPELDTFAPPYDFDRNAAAWPAGTRMLWDAWREDPVTQTWNASDRAFAVDTISLHATSGTSKANEIRIRMESLGLTPKGRRDLRLLLPEEEAPAEDGPAAAEPAARQRPAAV